MVTDEVLLNHLPSGKLIIKNGRSMIAPTAIDFSAGKATANGTGKPVPYRRPVAAADS